MLALRFLFTHMRLKAQTKKYPKLLKIYSAPNLPPIPNIILLPCIKKVSVYRMFHGTLTFYFHYSNKLVKTINFLRVYRGFPPIPSVF